MSRDHKPRARMAKKPSRSKGGILVGIFIGLLIGALCAVGAAWYFTRSSPFQEPPRRAESPVPAQPQGQGEATQTAPIVLPGKPGGRPVEKPQFDFYKILPQGEGAAAPVPSTSKQDASGPDGGERLYLQAGAFEDPSEADNVKAQLALMGIEASVQRAQTSNRGTVHRVRVGPFSSQSSLERKRAEMAAAGIDTSIVRVPAKP